MSKRLLIGLLSAGLVGAMLPGVAVADDLVGPERGLENLCGSQGGNFYDYGDDRLACWFNLYEMQRGDPSAIYPRWEKICASALGRYSEYINQGPSVGYLCEPHN